MANDIENVLLEEIQEMLAEKYPREKITMKTYLEYGDDLSLDMSSLDIIQFIIDLEKRYDIIIDIDDRFYTIGDVVRGIKSYLNEKVDSERRGAKD